MRPSGTVLRRIQRLAVRRRVRFTEKARDEMDVDDLDPCDVIESILNARAIRNSIRSRSLLRRHSREKLHVIQSFSFGGTPVYTKGAMVGQGEREGLCVTVSAKAATASGGP